MVAAHSARLATIESWLQANIPLTEPAPRRQRGRPPILPAVLLWAGLLVCVARGWTSQRSLWRVLSVHGLWDFPTQPISDDAVYRRLERTGPTPLAELFVAVTATLLETSAPDMDLAPFATEVVAFDETTLDPVARTLPVLHDIPPGSSTLLPGKVAAIFDLRHQLFQHIELTDAPHQNERQFAPLLRDQVPPGSLILADLGYFGFEWFDRLTNAHYWWLSRLRAKTSYTLVHTLYEDGDTLDALIWLGAYRADKARYLVRLIQIPHGQTVHRYITNVRDPDLLPLTTVGPLYARRWDIELAFKLLKRDLGLHLLWSAKRSVLLIQVWAALIIAQIALALRGQIARQAEVDIFDVSITLLLQELPKLAARGTRDPVAWFVDVGRDAGYIRDARRIAWDTPPVPPEAISPRPPGLPTEREPRYARRK